jgi:CO/xanthine dehydrogenase Mo-binding subunit
MNRRRFLQAGGALIVSFGAGSIASRFGGPSGLHAQRLNGAGSQQLDRWIRVNADGTVTAFTGKCELGHGLYTAQTQLVAEELCVPFSRVSLVQCDTELTPDQGTTSGAQSHPTNFNHRDLALAAATAREALLDLAAARLATTKEQLAVRDGVVTLRANADRRLTYADLIGGRTFNLTLNPDVRRKPAADWTILGASVPRVEIPAMVTGRFEFVHNVRVPGMLHGRVVRPPAMGARLTAVNEQSIRDLPGIVKVVVRRDFVGVVAEKPWQAVQAAGKLDVTWVPAPALPAQRELFSRLRTQTPTRDTRIVDAGDPDAALTRAARTVKATYTYPYQMHASMGTACAVADVQSGRATIWSATQAVYPLRSSTALLLGLQPENVHVIFRQGAGCYGINGADTVSYDAALLSQAAGRPVRVQLMRRDEMAWENYGLAFVIDEQAGLDASGNVVAWSHESWSPTLGGRPGANTPGNQVTGMLAGFEPAPFQARSPAPAPTTFANNSNAVPSYVTGEVSGRRQGTGRIAAQRVITHNVRSTFFTGPLRSPERLQNTFAHESFVDELAAAARVDPVEYRLRHLADPRLIAVLQAAATAARWERRPSPRVDLPRRGVVRGHGVSCVLYEGDNGYCALVAEVDVNQDTGAVTARRFFIANDSGPISNPDGLRNQLEGGALHGLSRTLLEEVTWDDKGITSIDWRTYKPLYLGAEVPSIDVVLINQPAEEAMGAGETAVTVVAAAVANAIFDATGVRLRDVPFTADRVKLALAARV